MKKQLQKDADLESDFADTSKLIRESAQRIYEAAEKISESSFHNPHAQRKRSGAAALSEESLGLTPAAPGPTATSIRKHTRTGSISRAARSAGESCRQSPILTSLALGFTAKSGSSLNRTCQDSQCAGEPALTPTVAPMNAPAPMSTSHSHLERLFLFRCLSAWGTEDKAFHQISNKLANHDFIKGQKYPTYDARRLNPDALRSLYINILRDEVMQESTAQQDGPELKKRKTQASTLGFKELQEYNDKLPTIAVRLEDEYIDYMTESIKRDEEALRRLDRNIEEINNGEWDDREEMPRINTTGERSPVKTNGQGAIAPHENTAILPATKSTASKPIMASPQIASRPQGLGIKDSPNSRESSAGFSPHPNQIPSNGTQKPSGNIQSPGVNVPHGPSPVLQQPPGMAFKWEPPYVAGTPPHQPHMYQQPQSSYPPYNAQQYPQPQYTAQRGTFSSHGPPPAHLQLPSSPHSAQHPNGMAFSPSNAGPRSPGMQLDALADLAGQQYRAPSGSPMPQGPPTPGGSYGQPYTPQQRPSSGTPQTGATSWNQQYPPQYQGTPHQPQFSGPQHPIHYQGHMQQPPPQQPMYHGSPQQSQPPQNQPPPPSFQQPRADPIPSNRQYNSPYNAGQGPKPTGNQTPGPRSSLPNNPSTPVSQMQLKYFTGGRTSWTPVAHGVTPTSSYKLNPPPSTEPISPQLLSRTLAAPPKGNKAMKVQKSKAASKRGRFRAGSAESSAVSKTTRSLSVVSHADNPDEPSMSSHVKDDSHVKEEVKTPLNLPDEETGDTTADELPPHPRAVARKKQPLDIITSPDNLKHKPIDNFLETPRTPHGSSKPPSHVLWTRNFPKISNSAIEEASRHRYAVLFNGPVKEKDAPGYFGVVLRPQDLKTIKLAIVAGNRAAIEQEKNLDDPQTSEKAIWLPISEDLIPPKGIINYAQLETELNRMFANAIMFAPDPLRGFGSLLGGNKHKQSGGGYEVDEDQMVKETRAMFVDVGKDVASLRNAEKRAIQAHPIRGASLARGSSVRGSSVARRGDSIARGSSVVATDQEDETASVADVETTSVAGSRRGGRKRKA
jgi:hypothetical protein